MSDSESCFNIEDGSEKTDSDNNQTEVDTDSEKEDGVDLL
jgi:hypothetical protein